MPEEQSVPRPERHVVDELYLPLFQLLGASAQLIKWDPAGRYSVLLFGSDYVVIRRGDFPDDTCALVYVTRSLSRAISLALAEHKESIPNRQLMQLSIIAGRGGMVGWQCARFQRIPLAPLEVAVVIESRRSHTTSPEDDDIFGD